MKNAPKQIFLQCQGAEPDTDFRELGGVTWSEERENPEDLQYVSAEMVREIACEFAEDFTLNADSWSAHDYYDEWIKKKITTNPE